MTLSEQVVALTSVVCAQAETIRDQNRTIEVLSGTRGKALNLDMPIRDMWTRYLQTLPDRKWVLSVKCTMVKFMDRHGDRPLGDLTVSFWEDYRDAPEIKSHYSVTSRNIQLKWLRAMLNWAVRSGRLSQNMLALAKLEKGKKKRQTEISFEGEAAVLRSLDELMRAFFLVGIDSAMRHDEIRMLEWSEIDWKQRTILGHAHLATTALYIRTQSKDVIEAHALLEKALRKGPHRAPSPSGEIEISPRPKKIA